MNEETLFEAALNMPEGERDAFLNRECAGDRPLRARVGALLAVHFEPGDLLALRAADAATVDAPPGSVRRNHRHAAASDTVGLILAGKYRLVERIGDGGMGSVWLAQQSEPVKRRVAVKLIKLGMDSKQVISRFEAERQALAMMDHPNIAKVLDGGLTPDGRPFFVMELVKGTPITEYCDVAKLSLKERLDLFVPVCHAIQHAHQKGIIHRDIKPSNVLIALYDDRPVPKVIDFGVAKATGQQLTDATLNTAFGGVVGTPQYMSPEQATLNNLDIDTRSDVYSLGVLLYELLTGSPPVTREELAEKGLVEMLRVVREDEAPKPSTRLSTAATLSTLSANRSIEPGKLRHMLRSELDWIALKALEKNRARRYETANGLASDVLRYLAGEPVTAHPPSAGYRLRKLLHKHRGPAMAAGVVAVVLLAGIAVSSWQAIRATQAKQQATAALDQLRNAAPAFVDQARALAAKEQFDEAIEKLDYAAKLRPDEASFLVAKGDLLQCQFKLAEAAAAYRQALRLKPDLSRAAESATLCDELLAAKSAENGKLNRESLAKLLLAMQQQQRPAAELMPVARLLGEEKKLLVEYWLERLKELPISGERPLEQRMGIRDDGLLVLDLSDTKVIDLSPLAGAPLAELDLTRISGSIDLSPLRQMLTLESLALDGTRTSDLSALHSLRLKSLRMSGCPVSDLSPLRGLPLQDLLLPNTRVADLSPLRGMPLKSLDLTAAPVLDFSPLAGLPLEKCYFQHNRITDLSVLRGMPLRELSLWGCSEARNYAVLREIKTLELLLLPREYRELPADDLASIASLRNMPKLRQLGSEIMNQMGFAATGSKEVFWRDWDREQKFLPALRNAGFKFSIHKLPSGTYDLTLSSQHISDLSILENAPIGELHLYGGSVVDLTPVRNLPLRVLQLDKNPVTDLSPLHGMRIEELYLSGTPVSDLSPLVGMPLKILYLDQCNAITDLGTLSKIPSLEKLTIPFGAGSTEQLRTMPHLKMLAHDGVPFETISTAQEFWKTWDSHPWIAAFEAARVRYTVNPNPDGTWNVSIMSPAFRDCSIFKGSRIRDLDLSGTNVTELSPLAGLPLQSLNLDRTPVSDLKPIGGLPLKHLYVRETRVTDISVLRQPPLCTALEDIHLYRTGVTDFAPVSACTALTTFDASETALPDLEPLRGRHLKSIFIATTRVKDLSILAGMPLESIFCDRLDAIDVTPLSKCPSLVNVILPRTAMKIDTLRGLPHVERISYVYDANIRGPSRSVAEFWKDFDEQGWLKALNESGIKVSKADPLDDGTWNVNLERSTITDLSILHGAPISILWLGGTNVADLKPLRGMPLKTLVLWSTKVTDLTPIKGMPLQDLHLAWTGIKDLSALRGMPLTSLRLHGCSNLTDVSPLAEDKGLITLTLPKEAVGIEFLRAMPHLERIGYADDAAHGWLPDKTAEEFWKDYDAKRSKDK